MFILFLGLSHFCIWAQHHDGDRHNGEKKEKIEALKRSYMTQELALTVAESEKFWPLYNESDKKNDDLKKEMHKHMKLLKDGGLSDSDVLLQVSQLSELRKQEIDLELALIKNVVPIIGAQRASKLPMIERDFHHMLAEKFKENHKGGGENHHHNSGHKRK
ncbi:MAG: hypothetical protein ACKO8Q_01630 [Bacteroidota bacterium]